jgi:hypothetical protein
MKISKTFDLDDQNWFAQISGDYNPIHINEIEARKLHSGGILVHGIHTVTWALDCFFKKKPQNKLSSLKTKFFKPIYLNQKLFIVFENVNNKKDIIKVYDKELLVSVILESSDLSFGDKIVDSKYHFDFPKEFKYNDESNVIPISLSKKMILDKYPFISNSVGLEIVSNIVGLSRLVGMECPGLNSLFVGFNINFNHKNVVNTNKIFWSINKYYSNQAPINISVKSSIMEGIVQAYIRPSPIIQLPFLEISKFTKNTINLNNTFSIIIGGSRGLGEVTSKIIASYGGNVIITYNNGKNEAIKICNDINTNTSSDLAVPLHLNIENPKNLFDYVTTNKIQINSIYYFATPKIKGIKSIELDEYLLNLYNLFYTVYFSRLLRLLNKNILNNEIKIFYPSTIFIDQKNENLMEYVLSKKNAEAYIESINYKLKNIDIVVDRLDMLNTDQNNSVFSVETKDPLIVMNDIVLRMNKNI